MLARPGIHTPLCRQPHRSVPSAGAPRTTWQITSGTRGYNRASLMPGPQGTHLRRYEIQAAPGAGGMGAPPICGGSQADLPIAVVVNWTAEPKK